MKNTNSEEALFRNSVPIMAWDFHYEYVNELKAVFADLKKVNKISSQFSWDEEDLKIEERIKAEVVVVTDLNLKIVFASNRIKSMTGYTEAEILGKTPRIFQGPTTCQTVLKEIREAIKSQVPFEKIIENYKKNGKPYSCKINGFPIYNLKGEVSHFIAFEQNALSA
ncbi:PAS domain-containing protein [Flavobacterium sp. JLP]|uniref:PAS domain-containing protein n=1 Tax=unclassified Flavobacterium TaxID=196869 RepID=UPI000492EF63|nr:MULTISPECIES: PAS domain-containing protein [unclassified Flavobacterium]MBF4492539.1 PAS domain-containing protein [Flavobacterium sp. MR2016-29]MBF4506181.1 PAS domain-containing protein [Flavobacterium sp. JLP]